MNDVNFCVFNSFSHDSWWEYGPVYVQNEQVSYKMDQRVHVEGMFSAFIFYFCVCWPVQ